MALTKLPKRGLADSSVDTSKIEDGTVQNLEFADATITNAKIADGTIENAKLSNSSITIDGSATSLGDSITTTNIGQIHNVEWQSVKTTDFTAVAAEGYFIDTTSGAVTVTLPASATIGDTIALKDYAGTFATNNLTIDRNGHNIQGTANDSLLSTNRASLVLVYADATKGWLYTDEHNVADLQGPLFTTATGGTITTTGDFKIHTFTSSGCFAVSTLGNGPTYSGGPSNVDYLVVAGGGAGAAGFGGGGGGAGGYRTTFPSPGCNAGAFSISQTTYPITVGAGATSQGGTPGSQTFQSNGSNSIFSTITSAGGGSGLGSFVSTRAYSGGSGGGIGNAGSGCGTLGGLGNTPPVSPPQGNPGGNWSGSYQLPHIGTGGGGAGGAGGGSPNSAGPGVGGPGATNSISGSPVTYAGGGSGSTFTCGGPAIAGGPGGGGAGGFGPGPGSTPGTSGTANTGGGGGGAGGNVSAAVQWGGNGGSGLVIIRYKYQ